MPPLKLRIAVLLVVFAAAATAQAFLQNHLAAVEDMPPTPLVRPLSELPLTLGSWVGEDTPIEEELQYADAHLQRTYVDSRRDQRLSLWIVYSGSGEDRQHHPEVCMAVAGQPEDPSVRQTFAVPGDPHPVQQYRFGRTGRSQWVFYWYYTLPAAGSEKDLSRSQQLYRRLRQKTGSVTVEVFAPEHAAHDVEGARRFVAEIDAAVRRHLPAGSVRGSRRMPVRVVEDPDETD